VTSKVLAGIEIAGNLLAILLGGFLTSVNLWLLVSNYGEHSYSCVGKPLPCLTYSKVDDPYAVVGLALLLGVLGLLLLATGLHIRTRGTIWLFVLLGISGVYWLMLVVGLGVLILGSLLSGLLVLIGCAAAVAAQLARRVDALTAN